MTHNPNPRRSPAINRRPVSAYSTNQPLRAGGRHGRVSTMAKTSTSILPKEHRKRLVDDGLAKITGDSITYSRLGYTDNLADPEEQVRADLYLDLVTNLGYGADDVIEFERLHKIGHPHKRSDAKVDILVKHPDGRPFMVIELKSPSEYDKYMESSLRTQLFNVAAVENQGHNSIAFLVYHTRYHKDGTLLEKTVCVDYSRYASFDEWEAAGRPNLRAIPSDYAAQVVSRFVKGAKPDLRIDVTREELQRIRKDLHNILWGGGKYQNELFFNLVGLFLVKIYDEKETEEGEPYRFQILIENGEPQSAESVYKTMNTLYFSALKEYLHYSEDDLAKVKDLVFDAPKVRYVVEVLQEISITVNEFDVIGDFFEGIVRGEFKQSKGQYLTHTNIIRFMVHGIRLGEMALRLVNTEKRLPLIIDPACGSGAFLIESMKVVTDYVLKNKRRVRRSEAVKEFVRSAFPDFRRNAWAREYIYGIEINGDLAMASKVNMVGHGDGSANVERNDSLGPFEEFELGLLQVSRAGGAYDRPVNEQFDVVLSNPPFSVTVDRDTARTFPASYLQGEKLLASMKTDADKEVATELLFIERWYQLLRAGGRLAVVLPESVLDTSSTRHIRVFLFRFFFVYGIVSLPNEAFAPYTTTKTNILFAEKKTAEQVAEWDKCWTRHSEHYAAVRKGLDPYLAAPDLHRRVGEVISRYCAETGEQIDDDELGDIIVSVSIAIREATDDDAGLTAARSSLLAVFADAGKEQQEKLGAIIDRKKSLAPGIAAYRSLLLSGDKLVELLRTLLGVVFQEDHKDLSTDELVAEYAEEIRYADHDWWVFREVCSEISRYTITMAHADEIGYKRGIRGEDDRPNELLCEKGGELKVDTDDPKVILDLLLANVQWSSPEV